MLQLLSKVPVGSGRGSYHMDTVGMELGRLLPKIMQILKKIQEIRQEEDPGPDKMLAKLQAGPRKKTNPG